MDRKMTELDVEAAKRLRIIWDQRKKDYGFTQETASDFLGMNQSSVSQYVRGALPLGVEATLKFAHFLGVDPLEIRPDLPEWALSKKPADSLSDDVVFVVRSFSQLSVPHKQVVRQLVDALRFAEIGNFN